MAKQEVPLPVLGDIEAILKVWNRLAIWNLTALVILGIIALISSLCISVFGDIIKDLTKIRVISFSGSLALGVLNAFSIGRKGNNARNAWRHLNRALYSYKAGLIDANLLIKAYEEGENILGDTSFNFDSTKSPKLALQKRKRRGI